MYGNPALILFSQLCWIQSLNESILTSYLHPTAIITDDVRGVCAGRLSSRLLREDLLPARARTVLPSSPTIQPTVAATHLQERAGRETGNFGSFT